MFASVIVAMMVLSHSGAHVIQENNMSVLAESWPNHCQNTQELQNSYWRITKGDSIHVRNRNRVIF